MILYCLTCPLPMVALLSSLDPWIRWNHFSNAFFYDYQCSHCGKAFFAAQQVLLQGELTTHRRCIITLHCRLRCQSFAPVYWPNLPSILRSSGFRDHALPQHWSAPVSPFTHDCNSGQSLHPLPGSNSFFSVSQMIIPRNGSLYHLPAANTYSCWSLWY